MSIEAIVLTAILVPTIVGAIGFRIHFRHASTLGDAVVTPPVFAVCGTLVGISIGMIWFQLGPNSGRVPLETSCPIAFLGASVGALTGVWARHIYQRLQRGKTIAILLVVTLLAGSIGAPSGWIIGDLTPKEDAHEQLRTSWMVGGLVIGSGIGFLLGLSELVLRRKGLT
jgi:hypothetical protein